jgi:hypothetical protein
MLTQTTSLHQEMRLSADEWCQLFYAVWEYGDGRPDDLIGIDGQDGCEEEFCVHVIEGFISNLRSKRRSIEMGEYGEEIPPLTDADWLSILREIERKLTFWLEIKAA